MWRNGKNPRPPLTTTTTTNSQTDIICACVLTLLCFPFFFLLFLSRSPSCVSFSHQIPGVQALGAIGLLALFLTSSGPVYEYSSTASSAFITTLILLIVLLCIPSLRSNQVWSWVELVITAILFIVYIIASYYVIKICLEILTRHGGVSNHLGPFIGTLIASVCIIACISNFFFIRCKKKSPQSDFNQFTFTANDSFENWFDQNKWFASWLNWLSFPFHDWLFDWIVCGGQHI